MNVVKKITSKEYMEIREKGTETEMVVFGQLRGGFDFEGAFYYIGKGCYKVTKL